MVAPSANIRSNRIESIDILRGFTLFGIIIVHMVEQYYAGQFPKQHENAIGQNMADQVVQGLVGMLIIGKFYMIFSFLFGLSFYIQFTRNDSEKNFLLRFAWRLLILFAIGMIHHLHYRGDILSIYAILGVGLLIFHQLPDKYLLLLAGFLVLNIPTVIVRAVQFAMGDTSNIFDQDQASLLAYYNAVKSGTYLDILNANLDSFAFKMIFQVFSGRLFITLGLFLLGVYAGRKKFFERAEHEVKMLKDFRFNAWMTILGAIAFSLLFFGGAALFKIKFPDGLNMLIGGFVSDLFNAALATIYVMWILLWLQKEKWQKHLANLYPVGRMGLTVYLMQTLFGTLIYFSYGLGLLGEFGASLSLVLALMIFVVQIVFAKIWFTYFNYGPVEWIWRDLSYLKVFPIRKKDQIEVVA